MASQNRTAQPDDDVKPDSPTEIKKPSWGYVLRKTLREFLDDQCTDIAAALTYYAVLSIFPALIALVSVLSLVGQGGTTNSIVGMVEKFVPAEAMKTLGPIIDRLTSAPAPGFGLILGLLVALWTASNYVNAFSRAMNRMYEIPEGRPFWKLRPTMYVLTAVMLVLVALAGVLLVVSGPIARAIGDAIGLGPAAVTAWNIAKWPVLLAVVIVIIALLYYVTPNIKQPKFHWISIGAIIAIVIGALASLAFAFYVGNFGSYDATYGTLAGVIVFLLWLYIMNLALLFGAEFDAELERGRELQAGIPAEESVQLPPRDTRASDKKAAKEREDIEKGRALRLSRGDTADADEVDEVDEKR
ncbi:YihY/virulence factor BrkB family protein [Georgenia sp. SYP-B2076]|uniref:YihY/virulence factor BrkB family protein n=1 Tax=Georgenia sp. SYP-B2076 TaxID=2495881 RepID=UPI000F8D8D00|nr:YihY/virulence factor BrkB family protein [Georgenia sp. SYP-B2076]